MIKQDHKDKNNHSEENISSTINQKIDSINEDKYTKDDVPNYKEWAGICENPF